VGLSRYRCEVIADIRSFFEGKIKNMLFYNKVIALTFFNVTSNFIIR